MPKVTVRLDAQVTDYVNGMRRAKQETKDLGSRLEITKREAGQAQRALAQQAEKSHQSMQKVGTVATKAGIAGAIGLAAVGKAAIDWESAFAGVTKTLDTSNKSWGTAAEQTSKVEQGLRGLAKTMPTSHEEIASVAEAAGQLGVAAPNVVDFTRVMVELGDTTNLSADEAATSIAQLMNIMGSAPDTVDNLGSALVYLGNHGASTEAQILDMGQRIAGAGHQIGLTSDQVLGFSSAIASVGVNVEAGGTAMSKVMGKMQAAVDLGGTSLDAFAQTAGMSTDAFQTLFKEDAAKGIDAVVEGLGNLQKNGGNVRQTLADMGITGQYEVDVLSRLAGASKAMGRETGLLTENLQNGKKGFSENTALAKEAATRYNTTASQIAISWNKIKDAAITAGGAILPVVADVATAVGGLANAFGKLDPATQKSLVWVLAIGTTGALAVGGVIKLVGAVRGAQEVLGGLALSSNRAVSAIGSIGAKAGIAAIAFAALVGGFALVDHQMYKSTLPNLEQMNKYLLDLAQNPGIDLNKKFRFTEFDDITEAVHGDIDGVNSALSRIGQNNTMDQMNEQWDSFAGTAKSATTQAKQAFDGIDKSLTALSSTAPDQAAAAFGRYVTEVRRGGGDVEGRLGTLIKLTPEYATQVRNTANANHVTITSTDQLIDLMTGKVPGGLEIATKATGKAAGGIDKVGQSAQDATDDIAKLVQAMEDEANAALQAAGTADSVQSAINAASRATKDYVQASRDAAEQDARDRGLGDRGVTAAGDAAEAAAKAALRTGQAFAGTTDEAIALREALRQVAQANLQHVQAMVDAGASTEEITQANAKARRAFLRTADAMNVPRKQARELADEYFHLGKIDAKPKITAPDDKALKAAKITKEQFDKLPKAIRTRIIATYNDGKRKEADRLLSQAQKKYYPKIEVKSNAASKTAELNRRMAEAKLRRANPEINVHSNAAEASRDAQNEMNKTHDTNVFIRIWRTFMGWFGAKPDEPDTGPRPRRSAGGGVWGAGTSTSDDILIKASNNEYVQRAAAVDKYGVAFMHALNNLWIDPRDLPRFAGGGSVTPTPTYTAPQPSMTARIDSGQLAAALVGMSTKGGKGSTINLYVNNPQAEPTSASIGAAAGYLAAY